MDVWRDIRLKARQRHHEAAAIAPDASSWSIVKAGLKLARLQIDEFESGTVYGSEVLGALEREDGFVRLAANLSPSQKAVVAAHELGHYWLHDETDFMVRTTEASFGGNPVELGVERVTAYSPYERRETQADIFAQEFLLPADVLREKLIHHKTKASQIAQEYDLPEDFVRMQAIRALLLPPLVAPAVSDVLLPVEHEPDTEQRTAAEWGDSPLIIDAGPGTGKTKTLVARIKYLIKCGVPPSSILTLTYSNKAAAEMMERIETISSTSASLIWTGTFHAFSLELLRLYHREAKLSQDFKVLDESMALEMFESQLADLPLNHYRNLWDPTVELRSILRAISRAKDEMITPDAYKASAISALNDAITPEEIEKAEKSVEIGQVYDLYQNAMEARNCVDFGDLVFKAVVLLSEHQNIRQDVKEKYKYVLVDEYQDVNFASTSLLEHITEQGQRLWVVADPRQSIYRFRGAFPGNVAAFTDRYSDAHRLRLKTNYRSCESVIRVFERFGATISAAPQPPASWVAYRGKVGHVEHTQAPTLYSEAVAIKDKIEQLKTSGIDYSDQAILGSTHLSLARFGKILQKLGVPVLYLGNLFERPEIRDLLSLLSLQTNTSGVGLIRVAQFAEYNVTREDALHIIHHARLIDEDPIAVCANAHTIPGMSKQGVEGLQRLSQHLSGIHKNTNAWYFLCHYLFEKSDYLYPLLTSDSVQARQNLIAIYQLLKFCREHLDKNKNKGGRQKLLDDIRRLERLDDDRQFRLVPPEATDIPAVKMMTIHASKGLEFLAVHLPQVATRYVPGQRRPLQCPAPKGLDNLNLSAEEHQAESECLFFVALSRAKNVLSISHAKNYTAKQTCNPSKYLSSLSGVLPSAEIMPASIPPLQKPETIPVDPQLEFEARHLELYTACPARYRYEAIDDIHQRVKDNAYLQFHICVRKTIQWMYSESAQGSKISTESAVQRLEQIWDEHKPNHAFEPFYLAEAIKLVTGATHFSMTGIDKDTALTASLNGKQIRVKPERVLVTPEGSVTFQRLKTGRKAKNEIKKPVWELMLLAGQQMYPGNRITLEACYPGLRELVSMIPSGGKGLQSYSDAIVSIESGLFPPSPNQNCPTCPFYFICTSEDIF